jgi:hypothetical protein
MQILARDGMGIKWDRENLIDYSLEHVSGSLPQLDEYGSEVAKPAQGRTPIHHPGTNSSTITTQSPEHGVSPIKDSLALKETPTENVYINSQMRQVDSKVERPRLQEKRLDSDTDLRERQYMAQLEIERSRTDKIEARLEDLSARLERIEAKMNQ